MCVTLIIHTLDMTHLHMHVFHVYACMHVCMCVSVYSCVHVCMYTCMYVCMYVCARTQVMPFVSCNGSELYIRPLCRKTGRRTLLWECARTHTHTRTHTSMHLHTQTYTSTHIPPLHTLTHTYARTRTRFACTYR